MTSQAMDNRDQKGPDVRSNIDDGSSSETLTHAHIQPTRFLNLREAIQDLRRRKDAGDKVASIVCDLSEKFAADPSEDAMIDAAAESMTGDPAIDAEIVDHVHAMWLLMDACAITRPSTESDRTIEGSGEKATSEIKI